MSEGVCKFCNKILPANYKYKYFHTECFDKFYEWQNEQDAFCCPYCGFDDFEEYEKNYDEGTEDVECPECGKIFEVTTSVSYSWSSCKREEDYTPEESLNERES